MEDQKLELDERGFPKDAANEFAKGLHKAGDKMLRDSEVESVILLMGFLSDLKSGELRVTECTKLILKMIENRKFPKRPLPF